MTVYSEYRFYSPLLDSEAIRISVSDGRTGEYFMIISNVDGKAYRESRDRAVAAIERAIELGLDPGEVRILPC
jgi:hypothetical protein